MAEPFVKQTQKTFLGGISDYLKSTALDRMFPNSSFVFARSLDYRSDPNSITLLPGAVKESGSIVTDLIKWGETIPSLTKYFFYGNTGNLYQRTNATPGVWTYISTVATSHGNGMAYFTGDDYLYYTGDKALGRYGPVSGTPQPSDNFLQAQGGVPLNTASLQLLSASSQYATAASSASLQITGNLTLEAYFKPTTLPTVGNSMTLLGKWDESGATRGYKMDINAISGFFGDGSDGVLTISSNTTEAPTDATCTGTATNQTLSATNAAFAQGQVILIMQMYGANAGQWERNTISSYTAGTITLGTPLLGSYVTGAQVRVTKQYSSVTINTGITYKPKDWSRNPKVGGVLAFLCSGTVTVSGTISANGGNGQDEKASGTALGSTVGGFQGSDGSGNGTGGSPGDGTGGVQLTAASAANGNGGGGCVVPNNSSKGSGGGAGNGGTGGVGASTGAATAGASGGLAGSVDLTTMVMGGGGGGNSVGAPTTAAASGSGGAIIFITAVTVTITGAITANGGNGGNAIYTGGDRGVAGSGGAGGSILIKAQTATLGTNLITANGGSAGTATTGQIAGGNGGVGRINLNYLTSYTGTTTPTLNVILDSSLVTTTTYQARLGISNDGTALEYLTYNLANFTTGLWQRLSISWTASTSTARFYLNGLLLGTYIGTKTAISSNASLLYVGANKTSVIANYLNSLIDDIRIWNNVQTATQIFNNNQAQLLGTEAGLQAYYKLNSASTDATANANNLTLVNTPTYSTDVPYPAPTTRLDIDVSFTTIGQTYTLPTAISEAASDTLTFTPVSDPQKSIDFNVDTVGTGNWTVTIHDQQNNVIATQTIANALMSTGYVEFTFTTPWRIVIGKTYHAHLTVNTGTSKVVTSVAANFSNADFHTYFAFLVTDTAYHPVTPFLNFMAIGNERYIAKWDGAFYYPNFITFPPGWRVRCFGFWREYMAIGVWKGTNIQDYPWGRVYFWDGISPTFNFFIDIGDGQVNALFGMDSDLYIMVGYRGFLYDYQGGFFYNTGNTKSNKLKRVPNNRDFASTDLLEILPGAFTMWRNLLQIGVGSSTSATIQKAVYSWGSYNQNYPDTLSCDYPISTGNRLSTVTIGCVFPAGTNLIIGWQDGIAFGADVINFSNAPASTGTLELMVEDDGTIYQNGLQLAVKADHLQLKTGEGFAVKYQPDRSGTWISSPQNNTTTGDQATFTRMPIDTANGRSREYEVAVDFFAIATSPTLVGLSLQGQALESEKKF